jgi:hypothetical protein
MPGEMHLTWQACLPCLQWSRSGALAGEGEYVSCARCRGALASATLALLDRAVFGEDLRPMLREPLLPQASRIGVDASRLGNLARVLLPGDGLHCSLAFVPGRIQLPGHIRLLLGHGARQLTGRSPPIHRRAQLPAVIALV